MTGIVVADRLGQQALRLVGVRRQHDLQPRNVREDRIEALRVLRGGAEAGAVHGADDERGHRLAAEHVAELCRLIEDLVEADAHEVDEHQLNDRAKAGRRRARSGADKRNFGKMRVEHALRPEFRAQALGDAERPAPGVLVAGRAGAAGNVLAHDDDAAVAPHFLADRLVDRLAIGFLRHSCPPTHLCLSSCPGLTRASIPLRSRTPAAYRNGLPDQVRQ